MSNLAWNQGTSIKLYLFFLKVQKMYRIIYITLSETA